MSLLSPVLFWWPQPPSPSFPFPSQQHHTQIQLRLSYVPTIWSHSSFKPSHSSLLSVFHQATPLPSSCLEIIFWSKRSCLDLDKGGDCINIWYTRSFVGWEEGILAQTDPHCKALGSDSFQHSWHLSARSTGTARLMWTQQDLIF